MLDGTHTGEVVLYYGFGEQARHEHMSDEYKDRYIIIALLKTPPWYTDNIREHLEFTYHHFIIVALIVGILVNDALQYYCCLICAVPF